MTAHQSRSHYLALDSVRGLAAVCVVIHHFVISEPLTAVLPHKAWIDVPFFHNAWLFVDLFFVLSGIVISINYVQSGFGTFDFREFVTRRVARIYPLHIITLLAFLVLRFIKLGLVDVGLLHVLPPEMEVNNFYSFFVNLLLLHALGFVNYLSWNGPSWSISAEFYTYLIFGAVVVLAQKLRDVRIVYFESLFLVAVSALVIVFVLHKKSIDFHVDFGIVRCVLSYFVGVLTLRVLTVLPSALSPSTQTIWQFGAAATAVAILCVVGMDARISFAAPLVFAILLGSLMAFPGRALPRLLSVHPLVWLGKRSYSIYMVHALVLVTIEYFARALGTQRLQTFDHFIPGAAASLLLLGLVVAVLAISNLTFAYIEIPGSRLVTNFFKKSIDENVAAVNGKAIR